MPTPWLSVVKRSGELGVFNAAKSWSVPLAKAMALFNAEGFGVKCVTQKDETAADVVVISATKQASYTYKGSRKYADEKFVITTKAGRKFDVLHGECRTLERRYKEGRQGDLFFAAIFLPGALKGATIEQKTLVVLHELIHAAGLDGGRPNGTTDEVGQDHDTEGIMYDIMNTSGKGLIENMKDNPNPAMPPVRVGTKTRASMTSLWGGNVTSNP